MQQQLCKNLLISFYIFTIIITTEAFTHRSCKKSEWKCDNGDCIEQEKLCNGPRDCLDGSDEISRTCFYVHCPSSSFFRCAYGACVSSDAECNGKKDCADNSDETSPRCTASGNNDGTKIYCSDDEFKCGSGECVPQYNTCDGKAHCRDASDETLELCEQEKCQSLTFRCAYGACIRGSLRCNGIKDCHDGSDETSTLCNRNVEIAITDVKSSLRSPSFITETTTTTTTTTTKPSGGCRIGFDQPNLIYVYGSDYDEIIKPGEYVEVGTTITYKCKPHHFLRRQKVNLCQDDNTWSESHPECIKYCPSEPLKGITTQATCDLNGRTVSCDQPLEVGTRATISCNILYSKPKDRVVKDVLVCDGDGQWDYHPYRCEQTCGIDPVLPKPFLTGADKTNNTLVPWHVSIFSKTSNSYEQICAGSIINAKVVVSAAHCFWDITKNKPHEKSKFRVGAGKYYRSYDAKEPLNVQILDVADIHIPHGYKDVYLYYLHDIAVLVLQDYIIFNTYIYPICIEWKSYADQFVKSNLEGRIAGWGKTEDGNPSEELRVADLQTLSYDDCVEQAEPKYKNSITGDKFCVLTLNGIGVCSGDSGGGIALSKTINGFKTYFLWGIVSNGLSEEKNCALSHLTTFTNVQFFREMIDLYESGNRPK